MALSLNEMHMRTLQAAAREAVTRAIIAVLPVAGTNDPHTVDIVSTKAIRDYLNSLPYTFICVAGEGLWDGHSSEGHIEYGEALGQQNPAFPKIFFAVDPTDGSSAIGWYGRGVVSALGMAAEGDLLRVPDICYAEKLAVGPAAAGARLSFSLSIGENIKSVAQQLGLPVSRIVVSVLNRQKPPKDRHAKLISDIYAAGAKVKLLENGDLMGGIEPCDPGSGVHLQAGSGGGPEMLLTAIGVSAMGGNLIARFQPADESQKDTLRTVTDGLSDGVLSLKQIVRGPSIFAVAAATEGPMMHAPIYLPNNRVTIDVLTVRSDERSISRDQDTRSW